MSSSPTSSNSDKTFTITPKNYFSQTTVYRIRITTGTKDSSGNSLTSQWTTSSGFQTVGDTTAPTIAQVTAVTTPTNDPTPDYTFSSSEAGTITYGGSCSSDNTSATTGNNTITLVSLSDDTYSDCTITVTDNGSNSVTLNMSLFVIDTTAPTVSSVYPTDNQSGVSITTDNITVTFSEAMDTTYVTTNTSDTYCSGTIRVSSSSDNFSTGNCVKMSSSSPASSNSNKTFTVDPTDNLSRGTKYKIRVTTGVRDRAGNTLTSQYETSTGFTTLFTQQLGTSSNDSGDSVAVDSSNNIYVTGTSGGGLDNNTNSGYSDIILVKYNSSGTKQWTQQLGTASNEFSLGVDVDSSDNIYVTGQTAGGLDGNTSAGLNDIFLVKYNSSGTKQWTQQLGTSSQDNGKSVAVDSSDNIYLTGITSGGLDNNTNSGLYDIFLVKYNSSGTKQWTQQLGTSSNDSANSVAVDSSNNIYVTGGTSGGLYGLNHGESDIFLVKYNSSGTKQWTKQLGTSSNDIAYGVTLDSSDNIYLTGTTGGGLDGNTSAGSDDIFLVKYNSSGTKQWTQQLGNLNGTVDYGYGVTVDSSDNIYVTGYTQGRFDGTTNSGGYDIFLVKYNSSGTYQWTQQLGTASGDYANEVNIDSSENIYVTGLTYGGLDGNTNSGGSDIFLVKYNSDGVKQ